MTNLTTFYKTDLLDDHTAADVNDLISSALRSEYKNIETLSATRVLLDVDTPLQRYECGAADRIVKLPAGDSVNNHAYLIFNASAAARTITLQSHDGLTDQATVAQGKGVLALPDGNGGYFVLTEPTASPGGGADENAVTSLIMAFGG
jgi:hypothetical protein